MPRKTLRLIVPSAARIRSIRGLHLLGERVYASNLWHINRYSAAMALFVGLFVAYMPMPGQMLVAAFLAMLFKCNMPLSVSLVWVTNPLTMPPFYFLAYRVGALILGTPVKPLNFELSFHWLGHSLITVWQPFLLGCLVCGTFFGSLGFFLMNLVWRWRIAYLWRRRKKQRQRKLSDPD